MPRTITVSLGGREYEISELPSRANAAWRAELKEKLSTVVGGVGSLGDAEISSPKDIARLVDQVADLLLSAPDAVVELVHGYCPQIKAEWDVIQELLYDSDVLNVFTKVLGLAYPFVQVANLARMAGRGQPPPQT